MIKRYDIGPRRRKATSQADGEDTASRTRPAFPATELTPHD
jgi:hypothetical protein